MSSSGISYLFRTNVKCQNCGCSYEIHVLTKDLFIAPCPGCLYHSLFTGNFQMLLTEDEVAILDKEFSMVPSGAVSQVNYTSRYKELPELKLENLADDIREILSDG